MANRVNAGEVKVVKPTALPDESVTVMIGVANPVVTALAASDCGSGFSDAELKNIELYLSAHYVCATDPDTVSEKFEGSSKTFQRGSNAQVGIMSTNMGQIANQLSNGCLAELEKPSSGVQFF